MDTLAGFHRTHYCGELRSSDIGKPASVCGWVQRVRNLGGLIFIDLRDRTGIVQCTFDSAENRSLSDKAFTVRSEFVLAVSGTVRSRGAGAVNSKLPTGEIELLSGELRILSRSETPPFEITEDSDVNDTLRLQYRYLDLRRADMQRTIAARHRITRCARRYYDENGFLEIETPMLTKSTPEGARDYLVPSRIHPGKFYALPQSPQQYKQLLMLAGFDRYMQITRCFRDEDLRADRQPEFTQIDLEMSFVDIDDVLAVNEGFLQTLFKEELDIDIPLPFLRMPWKEAMERFGSDKPDLRFGFELKDMTDIAAACDFKVFRSPAEEGGSVRLINVKGGGDRFSRKEIDGLAEFVKTYRAKGLAWIRLTGGAATSSFSKFMKEAETQAILARAEASDGDLVLIVADAKNEIVFAALGALRCECARRMGLLRPEDYRFLWVTEFPLLEFSEEEGRFVAVHHPFTAPMEEDLPLLDTDPGLCRAKAYDIVLNGIELGGGSIRIHSTELQDKMFQLLGFSEEDAMVRFGHLLRAFRYGAPPHGGMAYGLDRLVMLMTGKDSIRDVIAFPKVQNASEPMTGCPDVVDGKQLDELHIQISSSDSREE
ncbi:aspartate--tRNA ligase [Papillibacter cinnamivorans]|uniref:Aspartate--tRNA(Asp/Asn) ligase n=1 Tax=Papillibacter cinnamivorans DSM 12816 TaxID=1122930 RepID=A0A1W2A916_9FIRM|nr:aspartate--tRNA ligase [Papillibacter cinnamivorans]SMC57146.1 aspartyl-tRNA synthetase [Papillibacter cinnamivorans DSM 12816]